jgi:Zn-finger nucleic acid-binding protein
MTRVRGQQHDHCSACNVFEFPTSLAEAEDSIIGHGKKTEFNCGRCEQELQVGTLRNRTDVCFCENCRGFVIDSESLGHLIQDLRSEYKGPDDQPLPVEPGDLKGMHTCPACWEMMDAHPYYGPGNVVIDTCLPCKLAWFDHGELARIVRAPGARPKQASPSITKVTHAEPEMDDGPFVGILELVARSFH